MHAHTHRGFLAFPVQAASGNVACPATHLLIWSQLDRWVGGPGGDSLRRRRRGWRLVRCWSRQVGQATRLRCPHPWLAPLAALASQATGSRSARWWPDQLHMVPEGEGNEGGPAALLPWPGGTRTEGGIPLPLPPSHLPAGAMAAPTLGLGPCNGCPRPPHTHMTNCCHNNDKTGR